MNSFSFNQKVHFRLDGNWYGEGLVKEFNQGNLTVELLTDCKEFKPGQLIFVDAKEITFQS